MTIIKEWCDGRKEEISFKEASRLLIDIYGSPTDIWELLSHGEKLSTCTATYYTESYFANAQAGDPRVKQRRVRSYE
jgi:hypothetical protein